MEETSLQYRINYHQATWSYTQALSFHGLAVAALAWSRRVSRFKANVVQTIFRQVFAQAVRHNVQSKQALTPTAAVRRGAVGATDAALVTENKGNARRGP